MTNTDDIRSTLGDVVGRARSAAASTFVEQAPFVKGFTRLCDDGWRQGWHERNGGNLTYRLTDDEVEAARRGFAPEPGPWVPAAVDAPVLAGSHFLVTGSGSYMRNVAGDPAANIGIIEIDPVGSAYRAVWGFTGAPRPTSELPTHLLNHGARLEAGDERSRVLYHAHPASVIAMTFVVPLNSRAFSRSLWKSMTECAMIFPQGVGALPWMLPGGPEIAAATADLMVRFDAVVWGQHGVFATGEDFDSAFGLLHTIEKAADIYCRARAANGGSDRFLATIPDEGLRRIGQRYGVQVNEEFLD